MKSLVVRSRVALAIALFVAVAAMAAVTGGRAEATVITGSPVPFTATEGSAFNGAVATFTDDNPAATPADFTASIDWGDGSPVTTGTIGESSAAFVVVGQHTYADEGTFTVTVTIADVSPGTGTATVTSPGTVQDADQLAGTPRTFAAPQGVSFTTTVATFTDTFTAQLPSDLTATIDWGDATTSAGTITGGSGSFSVSGTHTYAGTGSFAVMVTLSDDKPGTATATVTSTANVAAGLAVTASNFSTPENTLFNGQVATFSDVDTTKTPADCTATIDWGDGTAATAGTITGGSGTFTVTGQHTYADEGSFTFSVTVSDGTLMSAGTGTATVSEADRLSGTPAAISAQAGVAFTGTVATFTDTSTANTPADLTATINWGDSGTSTGTVTGGSGTFTVSGTHTYATNGIFTVTVTLSDDPPGTATATAASTANVAAAPVGAIPALDFRGMLLLGFALAGAGVFVLRRLH